MELHIIIKIDPANKKEADATVDYFDREVTAALEKIHSHFAGGLKNGSTKNGTSYTTKIINTKLQ